MGRIPLVTVLLAGTMLSAQQPPIPPVGPLPPQPTTTNDQRPTTNEQRATDPQQPPRPPTFRTTLETVRVDATVIDSQGRPVTSLSVEDFTLEEDGAPQKIDQFRLVELNGRQADGDETSLAVTSRGHEMTEVAREDVRVFLVFWDDYHIQQLSATLLHTALKKFLRTNLGPTDMVAVMTQFTPTSHIRFRRDHEDMALDVDKLEGRRGNYMPRNVAEENHMRAQRGIEFVRSEVSASALRAAIAHLGAIREGRKTILYFSQEFGFGRATATQAMSLIQAANDANVVLYSVNPDGLQLNRSRWGLLTDVARNTGGESLQSNSLDLVIRRAVSQSTATYLLGYSPAPLRHDGKFHKIAVRVRGKGLHVRARNGYWAPSPGALKRAMDAAAAAPPTSSPVMKAFGELSRLGATSPLEDTPKPVRTILGSGSEVLNLAEPKVWSVRRPAELQAVQGDNPPAPVTVREFTRMERLILRVDVGGELAASARLTANLVGKGGSQLLAIPVSRVSPDATHWRVDLPLMSIARGDYVIAIEASQGSARATAFVPVRVTGG